MPPTIGINPTRNNQPDLPRSCNRRTDTASNGKKQPRYSTEDRIPITLTRALATKKEAKVRMSKPIAAMKKARLKNQYSDRLARPLNPTYCWKHEIVASRIGITSAGRPLWGIPCICGCRFHSNSPSQNGHANSPLASSSSSISSPQCGHKISTMWEHLSAHNKDLPGNRINNPNWILGSFYQNYSYRYTICIHHGNLHQLNFNQKN